MTAPPRPTVTIPVEPDERVLALIASAWSPTGAVTDTGLQRARAAYRQIVAHAQREAQVGR